MVEAMERRRCSARQMVEAVRAFVAERQIPPFMPATGLVWIAAGGPEWAAWSAFYRATKGKTQPMDSRGGWRFPTRWPPEMSDAG